MRLSLFAAAVLALSVTAQANAADPMRTDGMKACDSARLSAWFERQRQLTDGDVDPQKPIASPRECTFAAPAQARDTAARASATTVEVKSAEAKKEGGSY
jgi:hypothetical protein